MNRSLKTIPTFRSLIRGHFFAGLLVFIPLGVIAWILLSVIETVWSIHRILPLPLRPESWVTNPFLLVIFQTLITTVLLFFLIFGISLIGLISKHYFGKKILSFLSEVIQHIPVIRGIYSALDQLLKTLVTGSGKQFSRVVYVEYPRKGIWSLAFVTGDVKAKNIPPGHLNCFIPTTPNPTSGFHLIIPETDVKDTHLKVDEAFRTIISLGIVQKEE